MTQMRVGCQEHIAYLLASAMAIQDMGVGSTGMEGEGKPPFFWKNEWGERRELRPETFQQTGQMLLDFSNQAYREKHPDAPLGVPAGPVFLFNGATLLAWVRLEPVEVIKSAQGYALMARGTGWKASQARRFIRKLVRLAVRQLPGYRRASMGAPHDLESLMTLEQGPTG